MGGRFGALITTLPYTFGAPIDLVVRGTLANDRVYFEGLIGPWILFAEYPLRAHLAFGFGLQGSGLAFGFEVGWLDPSPIAGLRLAILI